jgi:hypothetical protein
MEVNRSHFLSGSYGKWVKEKSGFFSLAFLFFALNMQNLYLRYKFWFYFDSWDTKVLSRIYRTFFQNNIKGANNSNYFRKLGV